jgi:hypothetical protein
MAFIQLLVVVGNRLVNLILSQLREGVVDEFFRYDLMFDATVSTDPQISVGHIVIFFLVFPINLLTAYGCGRFFVLFAFVSHFAILNFYLLNIAHVFVVKLLQ